MGDLGTPLDSYGHLYNISGVPLAPGHLDALPVEDYRKTLQARLPRFRCIVRRLPGVPVGGPVPT